jgi:hypothetical protein
MNDRLLCFADTRSQSTFYYVAYHCAGMPMRPREPTRCVRDLEHGGFESIALE